MRAQTIATLLLVLLSTASGSASAAEESEGEAPSRLYFTGLLSVAATSLGPGGSATILTRLYYARIGLVGEGMGLVSSKTGGGLVLGLGSKGMNRPILDVLLEGGAHHHSVREREEWPDGTLSTWISANATIPYVGARAAVLFPGRVAGRNALNRFTFGPHVFVQRDLRTMNHLYDFAEDQAPRQLRIGGRFEVGLGFTIGVDTIPAK